MWKRLRNLVDTTVSELVELCKEYPYDDFDDFFDTDTLNDRAEIRKAERRVIAECARYFKDDPDKLEKWSKLYKE